MENNEFAGYVFSDPALLENALTHTSYANENKFSYDKANERLEFLGDAVVELSVSGFLYQKRPYMTEGDLTRLRASVVCEQSLAKVAKRLDLGAQLLMGKGEETGGGRERESTLADALEAVIGAAYLDGGFDAARRLVINLLESEIDTANPAAMDSKTFLQEYLQRDSASPITYEVIGESGPAHDKRFFVRLTYEGRALAEGEGRSKKEAEQNAAQKAVQALGADGRQHG